MTGLKQIERAALIDVFSFMCDGGGLYSNMYDGAYLESIRS